MYLVGKGCRHVSPARLRSRRGEWPLGDAGAAILEYVLLLALVALVAIGGLVYLGRSSASHARQTGNAVREVALRGSARDDRNGQGPKSWCSSGKSGCELTVAVGGQEVISFWVTGTGAGPYSYSLYTASRDGAEGSVPAFLKLYSQEQKVYVEPTQASCPPGAGRSYTYSGITLLAADRATPPDTGQLTFSVRVMCS